MSRAQAEALIRAELPEGTPDNLIELLGQSARMILAPPQPSTSRPTLAMDMMMAPRSGMGAISITPRNLVRANLISPRTIKDALAAGGALGTATVVGMSQFFGFLLAFTTLIARTVSREEALVLHKAWRVARFDDTFTLNDMAAVADELRDEYEIEKVSETDIRAYLNNLERAGALSATHNGYRLVETIFLY